MLDFLHFIIAAPEPIHDLSHAEGPSLWMSILHSNVIFVSTVVIGLILLMKYMNFTQKFIDAPRQKIIDELNNAKQEKESAIAALKEAEEKLNNAKNEADTIIANAQDQAEKMKEHIVTEANKEAERLLDQAQRNITAEREAAIVEMKKRLALAAVEVAEDQIITSLDQNWQESIIKDFVENLSNVKVN